MRNEFHPKRNQARQKLATLPLQRFRDLASDVYFELERRYPDFAMDVRPFHLCHLLTSLGATRVAVLPGARLWARLAISRRVHPPPPSLCHRPSASCSHPHVDEQRQPFESSV